MIAELKEEVNRLRELCQTIDDYHPNTSDYGALDEYDDLYTDLDDVSSEVLDALSDLMEQIADFAPDEE